MNKFEKLHSLIFLIFQLSISVEKLQDLKQMYTRECTTRLSLEQSVQDVSCLLDETQYQGIIPQRVRQSVERSLRLSQSFVPVAAVEDRQQQQFPAVNITQLGEDSETSSKFSGEGSS